MRGLVECGHCSIGCNCHRMGGRGARVHRYYYCRNHDRLRAGGARGGCPERNIRADALDDFVFEQVRQALLKPEQLLAGERAVIAGSPPSDGELLTAQQQRLERRLSQAEGERQRLLDAYQAELISLDELTRRSKQILARREQLAAEQATLRERHAELARQNRLSRGLAGFAERVAASLDELDFDARQRLMRLLVEKVRVSGWRVEIHLKIPLGEDSGEEREERPPRPGPGPSSDMGLSSVGRQRAEVPIELPPAHRARAGSLADLLYRCRL